MNQGVSLAILILSFTTMTSAAGLTHHYDVSTISNTPYGEILDTFMQRGVVECAKECSKNLLCRSVVFETSVQMCTTNRWTMGPASVPACDLGNDCVPASLSKYASKNMKTTIGYWCRYDYDCVDPMSECRLQSCSCKPGYSYDRNTYQCVSACGAYGTTFQLEHGKKLKDNNNAFFGGVTIETCMSNCISASSYVCKTVEYYPSLQLCYLSDFTSLEQPSIYVDDYLCELYTRDCM